MTASKTKRSIFLRILFIAAIVLFTFAAGTSYVLFFPNFNPEDEQDNLYIRNDDNYERIIGQLDDKKMLKNKLTFSAVSELFGYKEKIHPGRYIVKKGMNNFTLLRKLSSGRQDPVKLKINNIRTKAQLAGRLSDYIMADSTSIVTLLNDSAFLSGYDLTPESSVSIFIPNTYEVFWNTDANGIFKRMIKESDAFWTEKRKAEAAAIPMTKLEVITLASIIEEESNKTYEYPVIAGLYINRLKKDMPLQACPTIRFALNDYTIKRVLFRHLKIVSPYNTYKNKGLPPGPIRIPSIAGIDAVLNYKKHDYLFMCAKETLNGEHNFAATGAEHMRNAGKYQEALNARGIQ